MSVSVAGRELLSLAHESHFQVRMREDAYATADRAYATDRAHSLITERSLRQQTQNERIQRFKMLSGAGMQKSLNHSGYTPAPTDSLSTEMARQQDMARAAEQSRLARAQSRGPAGVLSGVHFTAEAGEVNVKVGVRTKPKSVGRDPILAQGNIEVSYGYDTAQSRTLKGGRRVDLADGRRNIITGEGHMETHGFDAFRRPMYGAGHLRPHHSSLSLFAQ